MPKMEDFLHHLKSKNYQSRKIALIENTSWAPSAVRAMKAILETMKDIEIIYGHDEVIALLSEMADKLL